MVNKKHHHLLLKKPKTPFDYLVYFFMVATPLFELPQALAIYSSKDATNVSIWTWGFFALANLVWVTYGLRHRLLPLIVAYTLYFVIEVTIVVGILIYS